MGETKVTERRTSQTTEVERREAPVVEDESVERPGEGPADGALAAA